MKCRQMIAWMMVLVSVCINAAFAAGKPVAIKSKKDKLSYTIGVDTGMNLKSHEIDVNPEMFLRGLQDGLSGSKTALSRKEMEKTLNTLQEELIKKRNSEIAVRAAKNERESTEFLKSNASKSGVTTLPSGLQYRVIEEGKGVIPEKTDTVSVGYEGRLIDGQIFDRSPDGSPATFALTKVIPGWTEALSLMKVGSTWEVFIPSKLAYGETGIGNVIGPNQALIFKIRLISVKGRDTESAQAKAS